MYHYEIISDEYRFEELIRDLFNAKYKTQSFQLYKAKGGTQHGIDVFSTEQKIVVQCKKKDISRTDKVLREELIKDFDKSLELVQHLPFDFDVFILASTTKKYGKVQDYAAQLSQVNPFDVQFLSWKSIERLIHKHKEIRSEYYPHLAGASNSSDSSGKIINLAQYINNSHIKGDITQVAGDLKFTTNKIVIQRFPSPKSIGGNPLLKQTIKAKFGKLGEERKKQFGRSAYSVMYRKFKKDFGITEGEWTQIWDWPDGCADTIIQYLDEKYSNTRAGRIERAAKRSGYIHTRGHLFKKENEILSHFGLDTKSPEVKQLLQKYFSVSSHKDLTSLQHWQWVCYLTKEVERMYEEYE